jgi:hypothetical protein
MGRDPVEEPLSAIESAVFMCLIQEHTIAEFESRVSTGPTNVDEEA